MKEKYPDIVRVFFCAKLLPQTGASLTTAMAAARTIVEPRCFLCAYLSFVLCIFTDSSEQSSSEWQVDALERILAAAATFVISRCSSCCQLDRGTGCGGNHCHIALLPRCISWDCALYPFKNLYWKLANFLYNHICHQQWLGWWRSIQTPYEKPLITSLCGGWCDISRFCGRISTLFSYSL